MCVYSCNIIIIVKLLLLLNPQEPHLVGATNQNRYTYITNRDTQDLSSEAAEVEMQFRKYVISF